MVFFPQFHAEARRCDTHINRNVTNAKAEYSKKRAWPAIYREGEAK
jgi:hypothetical protein